MSSNLSDIKRERKHLEQDAQLLANRIKLLQLEDEKIWKKIKETKKKAKQFSMIKQEQEEWAIIHNQQKVERERAISEKRNNYKILREMQKKEKNDLRSALFHFKQEEAFAVKYQRDSDIQSRRKNLDLIREENYQRRISVNNGKVLGKAKILQFKIKKNSIGREMYWKKIEEHEKVKQDKIKEVQEMERLEIELIKRLENTQSLHNHINDELENLIKSPGMNSIYSSMHYKKKYDSID
jgi:hypothetical protein